MTVVRNKLPFAYDAGVVNKATIRHALDFNYFGSQVKEFSITFAGEPAEDTSTKEYSRIRQLSADQYGRQYGVGHDSSGRRPLPPPTAGRPLFA